MPEQDESLIEAYNKWRGWADEKVCCDYGLKVALPPGDMTEDCLKEMQELTQEEFGVNTFFMSMLDDQVNDEYLLKGFEACVSSGCLAQVHAESSEIGKF